MKQFFSDLIRERRNGKVSSKKIWGHIVMILVSMAFIMDGYDFYEINEHLFDAMLIAGSTLIGITAISTMFKRSPKDTDNTKADEES